MSTTMIILTIVAVLAIAFIAYQFIKHNKDYERVKYTDKISTPEYSYRAPSRERSATSSLEAVRRTTARGSESPNVAPDPATSAAMHAALFSDSGDRSSSSSSSSSDSFSSDSGSSSTD